MRKMKHHEAMDSVGTHLKHEAMQHHEAMKHHEAIHHYAQGKYQNEVDKPSLPAEGKVENSMGCSDFKKEAMDISYGQAGQAGCKADGSKIISEFKDYHWAE